mmetsp:Transcript_32729/g.77162  ORF Transcript_32729/g.77162 Transcript_32729/m.77162 type:complete len:286 (+) Transcript_32729:3637-4494(+)
MVLEGHAERGIVFQRDQDVASLGGNDPGVGGQIGRNVRNCPVHHVLVFLLCGLFPSDELRLVFFQIEFHHGLGQFRGIGIYFSVVDQHQKRHGPVLHEQDQGMQDGEDSQDQGRREFGSVSRWNPHVFRERIQDVLFLVLFLFRRQLFNVHVHPVEPADFLGPAIGIVNVCKRVFQFGTQLGRSFHHLEPLTIGLFEKLAVRLSDRGGYPQDLVDIEDQKDDIIESDATATTPRAKLWLVGGDTENALRIGFLGIEHCSRSCRVCPRQRSIVRSRKTETIDSDTS